MSYDIEDIRKTEQVNKRIVEKEKNKLILVLAQECLQLIEDWKKMYYENIDLSEALSDSERII